MAKTKKRKIRWKRIIIGILIVLLILGISAYFGEKAYPQPGAVIMLIYRR